MGLNNIAYETQSDSPLRVLVVEDTPFNQKAARKMLEAMGCEVDIAENGQKALALYDSSYDFILLDVELPDLDGRDVCREIRKRERGRKSTYIAALTTCDHLEADCLAAGMDEFMLKPLMFDGIKDLMEKVQ